MTSMLMSIVPIQGHNVQHLRVCQSACVQHFLVGKGSRDKIYTNSQHDSSTSEEFPMHSPVIAMALSHTCNYQCH